MNLDADAEKPPSRRNLPRNTFRLGTLDSFDARKMWINCDHQMNFPSNPNRLYAVHENWNPDEISNPDCSGGPLWTLESPRLHLLPETGNRQKSGANGTVHRNPKLD